MHSPESNEEQPTPAAGQAPEQNGGVRDVRRASRFKLIGEEWKPQMPDPAPSE